MTETLKTATWCPRCKQASATFDAVARLWRCFFCGWKDGSR